MQQASQHEPVYYLVAAADFYMLFKAGVKKTMFLNKKFRCLFLAFRFLCFYGF